MATTDASPSDHSPPQQTPISEHTPSTSLVSGMFYSALGWLYPLCLPAIVVGVFFWQPAMPEIPDIPESVSKTQMEEVVRQQINDVVTKQVQETNQKNGSLETKVETLRGRLSDEIVKSSEVEEQLAAAKKELDELKKEPGADKISELQTQLKQAKSERTDAQTLNKNLRKELDETKQKLVVAKSNLEAQKTVNQQLTSWKTGFDPLLSKIPNDEKQWIKLFQAVELVEQTLKKPKNDFSPIAREVGEVVYNQVQGEVIDGINSQLRQLPKLTQQIALLNKAYQLQQAKEQVMVTVFDSKEVRASAYIPALESLVNTQVLPLQFQDYRWGMSVVTGSKLHKILSLQQASEIDWSLLRNLPSQEVTPDLENFSLMDGFVEGQGHRRCVLIFPSNIAPPDSAKDWKDIEVNVILLSPPKLQQDSPLLSYLDWDKVCRKLHGEAVLLPIQEDSKKLTTQDQEALIRRISRLLYPQLHLR